MKSLARIDVAMNKFSDQLFDIENPEERKELARPFGKLMIDTFTEVMLPIIRQYPELDPDKNGKEWYQSVKNLYMDEQKNQ